MLYQIYFLDDEFLVRFLRLSKYSTVKATEKLKFYLSCPKRYPECFGCFDVRQPKLLEMLHSNVAHIMPEVDNDGCRIFVIRIAYLDIENVTFLDAQRHSFLISEIGGNMEEIQIAGVKIIIDYSGVPMKYLNWLTPKDYKRLCELQQHPVWFRVKAVYIINLPSFGFHIANFLREFTSKKMKDRTKIIRDKNDLKDHMDVNLLLEEYDGKVSIEDCRKYANELLDEMQDKVLLLDKIEADFEDIGEACSRSEFEFGPMGSFRKLEID
jgi:hypothetical protein